MVRVTVIGAVAAVGLLLSAVGASAHGIATMTVDRAGYSAGDPVVVSGTFVDPEGAPVTAPATVTWGADGPVLGEAPIAADGSWTLSFSLPADTADGTFLLYAEVLDGSGVPLPGLLARAGLTVYVPAAAPPAAQTAPAAPEPTAPVVAPATPVVRSAQPAGSAETQAPDAVQSPAKAEPKAAPAPARARVRQPRVAAVRTPVAPAPAPAKVLIAPSPATHVTEPQAAARHTAPAPRARPATRPRPTRAAHRTTAAPRPDRGWQTIAPAALPAPRTQPVSTSARRQSDARPWTIAAGALLVLALLLGATGGGLALARRRSPDDSPDAVELELQAMIADERARPHVGAER